MAKRIFIPRSLDIAFIKSRRTALGLTMTQASERASISTRQQWHQIESGKTNVSIETLNAVAQALECDVKDLLA